MRYTNRCLPLPLPSNTYTIPAFHLVNIHQTAAPLDTPMPTPWSFFFPPPHPSRVSLSVVCYMYFQLVFRGYFTVIANVITSTNDK